MSRTRALSIPAILLIAAGAVLILRPRAATPPEVGASAPAFSLSDLSGNRLDLKSLRGRVVVLNFWATWCPPCVEEAPSLERFSVKFRKAGVEVIGVSVDQDESALRGFIADHHLSFPIARDPDQALASRYGTSKFPETYLIDREGNVAEKLIGPCNWDDPRLEDFIHRLAGIS